MSKDNIWGTDRLSPKKKQVSLLIQDYNSVGLVVDYVIGTLIVSRESILL